MVCESAAATVAAGDDEATRTAVYRRSQTSTSQVRRGPPQIWECAERCSMVCWATGRAVDCAAV